MVTRLSGVALADKIAAERINNGKLSAETENLLNQNKAESKQKQSVWLKDQQAKKEFGRGFQIELEKENRKKAGLSEYDIQQSNNAPAKTGKRKATSGAEIKEKAEGSKKLGELRNKSRAKALVLNAEHQAETQSASGKHIHKELKEARKLDPESVKGINEKELIQKAGEDFKPVEPDKTASNVTKNADDAIKNVDDAAKKTGNAIKNNTKKSGGFFSKIGKFFKGKGGKVAIGAGIVALIGAGAAWLYNKVSGKKSEDASASQKPETPVAAAPDNNEKTEETKPEEKPNKADKADKGDDTKPNKDVPKDYEVKKGDCVWNIAKQHLKDLSDDPNYNPTDAEILKHTKELMDLNQLQFEPDGYHVMIKPSDKLKLVA